MLENKRQSIIVKKLKEDGYFVTKLIKTSTNGICDILAIKEGKAMFIEVKQPNGVLSELQKYRINELKSFGCEVKVWTNYQEDYGQKKI
jgi:Holliday junction resolvase